MHVNTVHVNTGHVNTGHVNTVHVNTVHVNTVHVNTVPFRPCVPRAGTARVPCRHPRPRAHSQRHPKVGGAS